MFDQIKKNDLIRGSIVLFIMFNLANVIQFFYQLLMARMLGPVEYGVFAVAMSLVYFVMIPSESVQTVISKYTAKFNSNDKKGEIKYLVKRTFSKGSIYALIAFVVAIPFLFLFDYFTQIGFWISLLTTVMVFSIFLIPVQRGVMQGMKKFNALGINVVLEAFLRLVLAVIFVYIGMKAYGAVLGLILGTLFAILISFIPLKAVFKAKEEKTDLKGIYSASYPVLFTLVIIYVMQSLDLIIAKSVFSSQLAGQYAVANLLGKIIFFGTISISKAMFPLTSEKHATGIKTSHVFKKSFLIVTLLCFAALLVFGLFPKLVIGILFGSQYLDISHILFNMGVAFSFISLANLTLLYGISINKQANPVYLVLFIILQGTLLYYFSSSIYMYSIAMVISGFIAFIGSVILVMFKK